MPTKRAIPTTVVRIKNAHRFYRAMESSPLYPQLTLADDRSKEDLALFLSGAKDTPTLLEIGFGMGENLLACASAHPNFNFVGIEMFPVGALHCAQEVQAKDLPNLRVYYGDCRSIIQEHFPLCTFAGCFILYPDPWHKARHYKRRLINESFLQLLIPYLKPQAWLYCITDSESYASACRDLFQAQNKLQLWPPAAAASTIPAPCPAPSQAPHYQAPSPCLASSYLAPRQAPSPGLMPSYQAPSYAAPVLVPTETKFSKKASAAGRRAHHLVAGVMNSSGPS